MTTRTFNISALSPFLTYSPQRDLTNSAWSSDQGGLTNGNANSGNPGRVLNAGSGTVTITAFGSGIGFAGSIQGVYCTYTATLSTGPGNNQDASSLPAAQTAPPSTGMLASFTGLEIDNWQLQLRGDCENGSMIRVTEAVVEGWVGQQGGTVSSQLLDDTSSQLLYSGADWAMDSGLGAAFNNDTQHYTSVQGATMNITFSGSAIVVWASVDPQHGTYSVELHQNSSSYSNKNAMQMNGNNPFLAVPVPFYFISGLDPTQRYTLVMENTSNNGSYLDLDSIDIYTSTGGGPPNGGGLQTSGSDSGSNLGGSSNGSSNTNKTAIIAGAVGGGVILLLLIILILLWRRRKTKIKRGGVRVYLDNKDSSVGHAAPIPMHMQGNVAPNVYSPQSQQYLAERQGLLHSVGTSTASPTFPPPVAPGSHTTSSAYDPYAAYGGYSTPPGSVYAASSAAANPDPVQARRLGKAAEVEAARERMRVANAGDTIPSPITPNPAHSAVSQSWDTSSQTQSSVVGTQPPKVPEEPPPEYENP